MLRFQKAAFDKIGLGYDFSSPNIASSSENLDKGKSILGAPPKVE